MNPLQIFLHFVGKTDWENWSYIWSKTNFWVTKYLVARRRNICMSCTFQVKVRKSGWRWKWPARVPKSPSSRPKTPVSVTRDEKRNKKHFYSNKKTTKPGPITNDYHENFLKEKISIKTFANFFSNFWTLFGLCQKHLKSNEQKSFKKLVSRRVRESTSKRRVFCRWSGRFATCRLRRKSSRAKSIKLDRLARIKSRLPTMIESLPQLDLNLQTG